MGVFGVGVSHRAAAVVKAPLRRERLFSAKVPELPKHRKLRAEKYVIDKAVLFGFTIFIGRVIVVDFFPEVYVSRRARVVKKTVTARFVFTNIKRNVLIKRVTFGGVIAHAVRRFYSERPTGFVEFAALVAEAVNVFVLCASDVMIRPFAEFTLEIISERRAVGKQ